MSKCYPEKVIALAESYVGYKEKASNSQLEGFTANAGNKNWNMFADYIDKKYPNFYNGKKNGYDWCDCFVDCMFLMAYGYEDALRLLCQPEKSTGAGCLYSRGFYKARRRYSTIPKVGSQVFFAKNNSVYHTGLVVDVTDTHITTIEGNSGDQVARVTYSRAYQHIDGYGYPEYDQPEQNGVKTEMSYEEVAKKVIAGAYGNGASRKQALEAMGFDAAIVQDFVNALLNGWTLPKEPGAQEAVKNFLEIEVDLKKHDGIRINFI